MVKLPPRDPNSVLLYDYRTGETSGRFKDFAKKIAIESVPDPRMHYNLLLSTYYKIKRTIMQMIPAIYYHRKREKSIDSFLEHI